MFWVKITSGNHFPQNPHVWLSRKMIFFGKWLPVDQYFHLWPENDFLPSFSLQSNFGKRERERERVREAASKDSCQSDDRRRTLSSRRRRSRELQSDDRREDHDRRCDLASSRDRAVDRDLTFDQDHDQRRDLATRRSRDRNGASSRRVVREIAPSRARVASIAIVDDIFLGFVFSFFFSKHQKIFSGKFFEMQPNTWKYFPFPEISISEKYVFSGKRFTATKHSLNILYFSTSHWKLLGSCKFIFFWGNSNIY